MSSASFYSYNAMRNMFEPGSRTGHWPALPHPVWQAFEGKGKELSKESELPETKLVFNIYIAGHVYGISYPRNSRHCWTVKKEFIIVVVS